MKNLVKINVQSLSNAFFLTIYNPALRKILAVILLSLGAMQIWQHATQQSLKVVVAKHNLSPGIAITTDMILVREIKFDHLPASVLSDQKAVINKYVTVPVLAGEFITRTQILDNVAAENYLPSATNPRILPLAIHDLTIAKAIKPGQIVDIIAKLPRESLSNSSGKVLAKKCCCC